MNKYLRKFNLNNKTSIVIGGLGLIGLNAAYALAEAGSRVIIIDNYKKWKLLKKTILRKKLNILYENIDISNLDQIENNYKLILKKYSKCSVFVNASYPWTQDWKDSSFKKIKFSSLRANIDIHLNTYAWLAKMTADSFVKNKIEGSIIQLGSIYGVVGQNLNIYKKTNMKENLTYSLIKGGVINFTRQMASYYGKNNIRVNTVCPGGIAGHVADLSSKQSKQFVKNYSNQVPLKRLGNSEEVASTILFLSSSASSYITGTTIMVDGGWTAI